MSAKYTINGEEFEKADWANDYNSTKMLFKEGGWEIHGNPLRHLHLNPAISRVVHYCPSHKPEGYNQEYCHVWPSLHGNLKCPACQELMPDSIQTLWTLQNFDVDFSGMVLHGQVSGGIA